MSKFLRRLLIGPFLFFIYYLAFLFKAKGALEQFSKFLKNCAVQIEVKK